MLQKVKMKTKGPNKNLKPGKIIEVDMARATALIKGDHAEPYEEGGDEP